MNKALFDTMRILIDDAQRYYNGTIHNSGVHVDYIIQLRKQIRDLGADPLPYPEHLLCE